MAHHEIFSDINDESVALKNKFIAEYGGAPTESGKGCERRQTTCSRLLFSRVYSRVGLVKKKIDQSKVRITPTTKQNPTRELTSQPFPD